MVRLPGSETWQSLYDSKTGWLCLGDISVEEGDSMVEFLEGVVAVIRKRQLRALWLKPEMNPQDA